MAYLILDVKYTKHRISINIGISSLTRCRLSVDLLKGHELLLSRIPVKNNILHDENGSVSVLKIEAVCSVQHAVSVLRVTLRLRGVNCQS